MITNVIVTVAEVGRGSRAGCCARRKWGQASTMFRGPGAGLAPAQPCPCGAPMRARLRFGGASGRRPDVRKRLRRATNFDRHSASARRRTKDERASEIVSNCRPWHGPQTVKQLSFPKKKRGGRVRAALFDKRISDLHYAPLVRGLRTILKRESCSVASAKSGRISTAFL